MLCSLSGEIAREPVLSTKSGYIFEKSLLAKHLSRDPRDPITNEPMALADDTIPVQTTNEIVPPRPGGNSLPGMIQAFQDEWDALMLETYSLRQSLHSTRKELTQALYRYDAATRVIARLQSERDEARAQLSQLQTAAPVAEQKQPAAGESEMEIEPTPNPDRVETPQIPADIVDALKKNCSDLSSKRRSAFKNPPGTLASKQQIAEYQMTTKVALHLTSKPGITCVDAHQKSSNLIATGGIDCRVVIVDAETERVKSTLKAHEKQVNSVAFHKERLLVASASDDGTVRLWSGSDASSFKLSNTFEDHSDAVTGLSMHSSGHYIGAASKDMTWSFYDIDSEKLIHKYESDNIINGFSCGAFHPDGVLFAAGSGKDIVVWDCLSPRPVQVLEGHTGQVTSLSFSENGYYMASSDSNGTAKIFDLRKVQSVHEFPQQDHIGAVRFNSTGHYLAIAGDSVQVYEVVKQWPLITTLAKVNSGKKSHPFSDVVFGADSAFIATVSMDRHLSVYSKPNGE